MKHILNYSVKSVVIILSIVLFSSCVGKFTVKNEQKVVFDSSASSKTITTESIELFNIYLLPEGKDTSHVNYTYDEKIGNGKTTAIQRGWLKVEDNNPEDDGPIILTITVEKNTTGAKREANVDLQLDGMYYLERITVVQEK